VGEGEHHRLSRFVSLLVREEVLFAGL